MALPWLLFLSSSQDPGKLLFQSADLKHRWGEKSREELRGADKHGISFPGLGHMCASQSGYSPDSAF